MTRSSRKRRNDEGNGNEHRAQTLVTHSEFSSDTLSNDDHGGPRSPTARASQLAWLLCAWQVAQQFAMEPNCSSSFGFIIGRQREARAG